MKKKIKLKYLNIIIFIILLISITIFTISIKNIIFWYIDSKATIKELDNISKNTTIKDISDTNDTEIIPPENDIPSTDPYWSYISVNLIDVDFNNLLSINKDTIGWIQVPGTNVNYPFVKTTDNSYYLTHSFDKTYNSSGWVFLDYRNNFTNDKNTIIYAHGRYDNTMFGSLRNITTNGWLNNLDNFIIKISTPEENTLWQVFSIYKIPTTSDYLEVSFATEEEFQNFTNKLINRSIHTFNTKVSKNDKIITLSTCYNDDIKSVLHAKLIKKEKR